MNLRIMWFYTFYLICLSVFIKSGHELYGQPSYGWYPQHVHDEQNIGDWTILFPVTDFIICCKSIYDINTLWYLDYSLLHYNIFNFISIKSHHQILQIWHTFYMSMGIKWFVYKKHLIKDKIILKDRIQIKKIKDKIRLRRSFSNCPCQKCTHALVRK